MKVVLARMAEHFARGGDHGTISASASHLRCSTAIVDRICRDPARLLLNGEATLAERLPCKHLAARGATPRRQPSQRQLCPIARMSDQAGSQPQALHWSSVQHRKQQPVLQQVGPMPASFSSAKALSRICLPASSKSIFARHSPSRWAQKCIRDFVKFVEVVCDGLDLFMFPLMAKA